MAFWTRKKKIAAWLGAAVLVVAGIATTAVVLTLRSDWFREQVRGRIVTEVEKASGGKVELGSFAMDWQGLEASVTNFVLHGTEKPGEDPLVRIERVKLGIHVLSAVQRRVELRKLEVKKPKVHVIVDADGKTNFPGPKIARPGGNWAEQLLALKMKELVVEDGLVDFASRKTPFSLRAENTQVDLIWDGNGPRYRGKVSARQLHVDVPALGWPKDRPNAWDLDATLALDKTGLQFEETRLAMGKSVVEVKGWLQDWKSPHAELDMTGDFALSELVKPLRLPVEPVGKVRANGKWLLGGAAPYHFVGTAEVTGGAVKQGDVDIRSVRATGLVEFDPDLLKVSRLRVAAEEGSFSGTARIERFRDYVVDGDLSRVKVEVVDSVVSGPVKVKGSFAKGEEKALEVTAVVDLSPADGPLPVEGHAEVTYNRATGAIRLAETRVSTPATKLAVSGVVGERLTVDLDTTSFDEYPVVMERLTGRRPEALPVKLENGRARFQGEVTDPQGEARVKGHAVVTRIVYEGRKIDEVEGDVDVRKEHLEATHVALEQSGTRVEGNLGMTLGEWKPVLDGAWKGEFGLSGAPLETLVKEAGQQVKVGGVASGKFQVSGTPNAPVVDGKAAVVKLAYEGETFDRATVDGTFRMDSITVRAGRLERGSARADFSGRYEHPKGDYQNGKARLDVATQGLRLADVRQVEEAVKGLAARVEAKASLEFQVAKGVAQIARLDGTAGLTGVSWNNKPLGNLRIEGTTRSNLVAVSLGGDLRGAPFKGSGEWQLGGDSPGLGQLNLAPLTMAQIQELFTSSGEKPRDFPFTGTVEASVVLAGSLRVPSTLRARIEIPRLELRPKADNERIGNAKAEDLVLRNSQPLVFEATSRGVQLVQVQMVGKDTNLSASGLIGYEGKNPWNLSVTGGLNMVVLQEFYTGLKASGNAALNAQVRGTLTNPQLSGRMEVKKATLYYRDLPNGIDNANGLVLFDRNRLVLQNLTAQTGGGDVTLGGFLSFGSEEEEAAYRVQLKATNVRIRYPEGASTTASGDLTLSGSGDRSVLAGELQIERSAFNPKTDFASVLLQPSRPAVAPGPSSAFLQGMQFDVRVTNAPNLQLETSLARGIQAEIELRLRGSPAKPTLLGHMSVNQGEIFFFGNKYTIVRGEVAFYNPARIEPVIDLDLETQVRAVTVNINFSGTLSKLNATYRSDPPLQSAEIVALLAVGRAPYSNPSLTAPTTVSTQGSSAETLLGNAVAAGVTSRLQRLFGVSRLKIDPQLTGLDSAPQARVTIEQQISREITITYVTNITGTQQQLLRLQWDVRKEWSVSAVRDENGYFGLDIFYRRRVK